MKLYVFTVEIEKNIRKIICSHPRRNDYEHSGLYSFSSFKYTHIHTHTSNPSLANVDLSLQTSVIDRYSFLLSLPLPTSLI